MSFMWRTARWGIAPWDQFFRGDRAADSKNYALENAQIIGARYEIIYTQEMQKQAFVQNSPDRCFHCKDELYGVLKDIAAERRIELIVDGTNADDVGDYRPAARRPPSTACTVRWLKSE